MTAEEILSTLQDCHAMVWALRRELGNRWPTPSTQDSLRFAVTEAAEALDALLRRNPIYARNSDREMSVNAELADCAMMLLTAMGETWWKFFDERWIDDEVTHPVTIDLIVRETANATVDWAEEQRPKTFYRMSASYALIDIAIYPGLDLRTELAARLDRIRRKHGTRDLAPDHTAAQAVQVQYARNATEYGEQVTRAMGCHQ